MSDDSKCLNCGQTFQPENSDAKAFAGYCSRECETEHATRTQLFAVLEQVTARLVAEGLRATVEHPGFVSVDLGPDRFASFGTANPMWGGHLDTEDGQGLDAVTFDLPDTSTDVAAIVDAIRGACSRWRR